MSCNMHRKETTMSKPSIYDLNAIDDLLDLALSAPRKKHDRAIYYYNRVNDLLPVYESAVLLGELNIIPLVYNDLSKAFRKLVKPLTTHPSWYDKDDYEAALSSVIDDFFMHGEKDVCF